MDTLPITVVRFFDNVELPLLVVALVTGHLLLLLANIWQKIKVARLSCSTCFWVA